MLRVVFMGTPDFAVPALIEIIGQGHEVLAAYSQPPRRSGRGQDVHPSPVHAQADTLAIPVFTPESLKTDESIETFRGLEADVAVVIAYGMLLPKPILDAPVHGCLNVHASLLPRWRGAAPIQRAIMAGDNETGVMVMRMEEGLDTGPVAMAERTTIGVNETAGSLHDRLSRLGADLIVRALAGLSRDALTFTPQAESGVTYARKIDKAETRIDWSLPAIDVHNHVRGLSPFPGAWFELDRDGKSERVKVLESAVVDADGPPGRIVDNALTIACGQGAVALRRLQRAGKSALSATDFQRGVALGEGTVLG
ncbi:MAG: methionyl-tRNA formyltransferase [Pseudomonadota bacterium]